MEPVKYQDRRQERIARLLELVSSGAAAFFRDACRMMEAPDRLECTSHFVGHALREIESAIRDVVLPPSVKGGGGREAHRRKDGEAHRSEIEAALTELGIRREDDVGAAWLRLSEPDNGLARVAHRNSLGRARSVDDAFLNTWERMLRLLDALLAKLEKWYAEVYKRIDDLVAQGPPADAERQRVSDAILKTIPRSLHVLEYLFKLTDPAWLPALQGAGLFDYPPETRYDDETDTYRFDRWPASEYLIRIAEAAPETVGEIAERIKTNNPAVLADLVEIACRLPAERAARFVHQCADWSKLPHWYRLPRGLINLVVHLAHGGQADAAFELARSLLALHPDPRQDEKRAVQRPPKPQKLREDVLCQEALTSCVPALAELDDWRTLELLCRLLRDACTYAQASDTDADAFDDMSWAYRPAIEDHEQNRPPWVPTGQIVTAVRDVAEGVIRRTPGRFGEIIRLLRGHPFGLFHRVALHLTRLHGDNDLGCVAEMLTDPRLFSSTTTWHEYALLARDRFAGLTEEQQAAVLRLVETGPDVTGRRLSSVSVDGAPPALDDERAWIEQWQLRRLAPFRDALPLESQNRVAGLAAQYGEPEFPDFVSWSSGIIWGPQSPVGPADLTVMSVPELIRYLSEWEPPGGFMGPTPDGLSRALTAAVASAPELYAEQADQFTVLEEPTYVSAVLQGFYNALREKRAFAWPQVLVLCRHAAEHPREIFGRGADTRDRDPHWGWARRSAASLIEEGLKKGEGEIPIDFRREVWNVLRLLSTDPEPTPEHEAKYGGDNMDPVTMSVNTVRGCCMHAVMQYGLWVSRHRDDTPDREAAHVADAMPELWQMLDELLDLSREPSSTVRAVFGVYLGPLYAMNREWVIARLARIFPPDDELAHLWEAAWLGYVAYTPPQPQLLDAMHDVYATAIARIGAGRPSTLGLNVDERLGEHLLTFYVLGMLALDEPDSLLVRFFETAPLDLRGGTVRYAGRALCQRGQEFTHEQLARLRQFFEWRLAAVRASPNDDEAQELEYFGEWFGSGAFDDKWSLETLAAVLRLCGRVNPSQLVIERLAHLAPEYPLKCVKRLGSMLGRRSNWWLASQGQQEQRAILRAALERENQSAHRKARQVISRLAARGVPDYLDLLKD